MNISNSSYYRKISLAIVLSGLVFLLLFPGTVFSFLLEFFHTLYELLFELSDLLFEVVETGLDQLIEHFFETGLHETQTIVFYIMVIPLIYAGYRLLRWLYSFFGRCKEKWINAGIKYKSDGIMYWQNLSAVGKIKLVAIASTTLVFYVIYLSSF